MKLENRRHLTKRPYNDMSTTSLGEEVDIGDEPSEEIDDDDAEGKMKFYPFVKGQVPRYHYQDPEGLGLVATQIPVILTGSDLVGTASKWDLPYLEQHLGPGLFAVFCHNSENDRKGGSSDSSSEGSRSPKPNRDPDSDPMVDAQERIPLNHPFGAPVPMPAPNDPSESYKKPKLSRKRARSKSSLHVFKYFDDKKLQALQDKSTFQQDIVRLEMTFEDFLRRYRGDRKKERVYLQQPLSNTVGRQIATDFVGFNWNWAMEMQKHWGWGPLTSNLLLIGQKGNITPCHYDEQQNLFCQLQGSKRFLLFSPDNFFALYPYPVHHPHDRQSQVNLDQPDMSSFPNFANSRAVEAIVHPGDILYIPMYWWHHVINLEDTIAINFWHKAGANPVSVEYPLKARQKVAMIRNVEKMLLEALQDQQELSTVLHWMVDGRF